MTGLKLEMLTKQEFVPEHGEVYIAFLVDDFYGNLEYVELECEFHYHMINADDGYPVPCSVTYNNQDELPFDVPLLFNKGTKKYEMLTSQQVEARKEHEDPEQRFWMEKTWFLSGRGMLQIQPEELDEMSIGIMKKKDFVTQVKEANKPRIAIKEENRNAR